MNKENKKEEFVRETVSLCDSFCGFKRFQFLNTYKWTILDHRESGGPAHPEAKKEGAGLENNFVRPAGFWPKNTVGPLP